MQESLSDSCNERNDLVDFKVLLVDRNQIITVSISTNIFKNRKMLIQKIKDFADLTKDYTGKIIAYLPSGENLEIY